MRSVTAPPELTFRMNASTGLAEYSSRSPAFSLTETAHRQYSVPVPTPRNSMRGLVTAPVNVSCRTAGSCPSGGISTVKPESNAAVNAAEPKNSVPNRAADAGARSSRMFSFVFLNHGVSERKLMGT